MTQHHFETHEPVDLYVEIEQGADPGDRPARPPRRPSRSPAADADEVVVEQSGRQISVIAPRRRGGFFSGDSDLRVSIVRPDRQRPDQPHRQRRPPVDRHRRQLPRQDRLRRRRGRPRVRPQPGRDRLRRRDASTTRRTRCGSRAAPATSPSGTPRARSRSSTGSGDVEIGDSGGPTVVKTGSGDLRVGEARTDVSMATGSGDLVDRRPPTAARSPPRARPATYGSASRPASPCGPTSPPCPARSTPTSRAPASPRTAPTTSSCGPRPSAATSSSGSSDHPTDPRHEIKEHHHGPAHRDPGPAPDPRASSSRAAEPHVPQVPPAAPLRRPPPPHRRPDRQLRLTGIVRRRLWSPDGALSDQNVVGLSGRPQERIATPRRQ